MPKSPQYTQAQKDYMLSLPPLISHATVVKRNDWHEIMGSIPARKAFAMLYYWRGKRGRLVQLRKNLSRRIDLAPKISVKSRKGKPHGKVSRSTVRNTAPFTNRHLKFCPECGTALTGLEAFLEARAAAAATRAISA